MLLVKSSTLSHTKLSTELEYTMMSRSDISAEHAAYVVLGVGIYQQSAWQQAQGLHSLA